ncbi:hypothetical protein CBS63078_7858 [Aspergillus niger]|nr:hypothetical protein CBS115989_9629 [Aspergillus niger]KAI2839144.1 hypothetical protein CBS11232_9442 [Aspergillus niger]KAI2866971.1 hypothetical protein CBS12448_844 [Aspergillus niger]KAI2873498.1 hypothetical protein CBS115988_6937 [Aspergillus niger]KAI2890783.1 hypothetical protein CBS13152_5439 [Aspergillus niger]
MAPMILSRRSWASGRPMPGTAQRAFIETLPGYGRVLESHNPHRHDLLTAIVICGMCWTYLAIYAFTRALGSQHLARQSLKPFGSGYGQQRDPPYKYRSLLAFPRPFLLLPPINTFSVVEYKPSKFSPHFLTRGTTRSTAGAHPTVVGHRTTHYTSSKQLAV